MLMTLLSVIGHQNGVVAFLAPAMVGALIGFLFFNFPPARLYLGDGGGIFPGVPGREPTVSADRGKEQISVPSRRAIFAGVSTDGCGGNRFCGEACAGCRSFVPTAAFASSHLRRRSISFEGRFVFVRLEPGYCMVIGLLAYLSGGRWVPILLVATLLILLSCAVVLQTHSSLAGDARNVCQLWSMRKEIQHALSLVRWMNLESRRYSSLNDLWRNLVFAADTLGLLL
jgi:UDP-GlcNAc:undecaprenyl-phosphate GlcNAc-1-phosphate transferase